MVNFRIVENAPPIYIENYEEYIDLYNNSSLTVMEIINKLDWTQSTYKQARKQALKENRLIQRKIIKKTKPNKNKKIKQKSAPKHYSRTIDGKFVVLKRFYKGKTLYRNVYCGIYKTEAEAQEIVKEMKKVNWDESYLDEIKRKVVQDDK